MKPNWPARMSVPLLLLLLLLTGGGSLHAATLQVETDRERLSLDETLNLRLTAPGGVSGEPDLTPLQGDFEILGRSQNTRTTIVNRSMSQTRELILELAPRRAGTLTIPALTWGSARSAPRAVTVTETPAAAGTGTRALFVQAEADRPDPYVQETLGYRVRVFYREEPRQASLSEPQADGAILERDGEDRAYTQTIDGQRYGVIERRYRLTPQVSGPLTVAGPRLEALVPDPNRARALQPGDLTDFESLFGGMPSPGVQAPGRAGGLRRAVERAPEVRLTVRPQPPGAASPWLPARSASLTEEWTPAPPRLQVGEPVTRTLRLTVEGATAAALPPLAPGQPDGARSYPDPPRTENLPGTADVPAAAMTLQTALVPSRPGPLTLPEIRVPWWDTQSDQARVAVIPARTLTVAPALDAAPVPAPAPAAVPQPSQFSAAPAPAAATAAPPASAPATPGAAPIWTNPWPWAALLLGGGWLATLLWWRRDRRRAGAAAPTAARGAVPDHPTLAACQTRFAAACRAGEAQAARQALLDWGRARWPDAPPPGLGGVAARLAAALPAEQADALEAALAALDRAIYARSDARWDGAACWRCLRPILAGRDDSRAPAARSGPLPELYPSHR